MKTVKVISIMELSEINTDAIIIREDEKVVIYGILQYIDEESVEITVKEGEDTGIALFCKLGASFPTESIIVDFSKKAELKAKIDAWLAKNEDEYLEEALKNFPDANTSVHDISDDDLYILVRDGIIDFWRETSGDDEYKDLDQIIDYAYMEPTPGDDDEDNDEEEEY